MGVRGDAVWDELGEVLTATFRAHTKEVRITDDDRVVVVWRGPMPASVASRLAPFVKGGDLALERWQPESLRPVVRHVANRLRDDLEVAVDTEASHPPREPAGDEPALHGPALHGPALHGPALHGPALHRPAGRVRVVVDVAAGRLETARRLVATIAADYGVSVDLTTSA